MESNKKVQTKAIINEKDILHRKAELKNKKIVSDHKAMTISVEIPNKNIEETEKINNTEEKKSFIYIKKKLSEDDTNAIKEKSISIM